MQTLDLTLELVLIVPLYKEFVRKENIDAVPIEIAEFDSKDDSTIIIESEISNVAIEINKCTA